MSKRKISIVMAFSLLIVAGVGSAGSIKSGAARVSLLELYTSEGCSSCPPAEKWLSGLAESPNLWARFVPVSFHVDYWDSLGWRDPLASDKYTSRQYLYAQKWDSRAVYTPGFVLNGTEWRRWASSAEPPVELSEPAGELEIEILSENTFRVVYAPTDKQITSWQATVVLLGFGIVSPVKRGENSGKTLEHNFSAIGYAQGALKKEGAVFAQTFKIKQDVKMPSQKQAVAAWVTKDGMLPMQAAGGYIN